MLNWPDMFLGIYSGPILILVGLFLYIKRPKQEVATEKPIPPTDKEPDLVDTNPTIHRVLVTTGCLMWIASFFGEAFGGQPYSTIGTIISPPMTIIGVIFWFKYYRRTRGHYPRLKSVWDNMSYLGGKFFLGFDFMFSHILEFWTFCILFWMGLVLIMVLTFRNSDAFEATKKYCQSHQEILSQTGTIKYYGVLVGGSISTGGSQGGNADFSFTIVGANGNFNANSKLTKQGSEWVVENVELR